MSHGTTLSQRKPAQHGWRFTGAHAIDGLSEKSSDPMTKTALSRVGVGGYRRSSREVKPG
jgi:hypothetical protein